MTRRKEGEGVGHFATEVQKALKDTLRTDFHVFTKSQQISLFSPSLYITYYAHILIWLS